MQHLAMHQPRLLTGDTPTGRLHLGHWVGSLENRVRLQADHECFFIIANMHAFTTRFEHPKAIFESVWDIVLDYLAAGIDPSRSAIFVQSEIPVIAELTFLFSMLISYPRLMRNPTIKDEIRDKQLGDQYPFGFLLYPVGQVADILAFRPSLVPVGEDQLPHLEMAREVARKFNHLYCGVDPKTPDEDHVKVGGLFPIIQPLVGRSKRLVGIGAPNDEGQLLKMSKSLNNAIFLSDTPDEIRRKVKSMYTDPERKRATDPGRVENNPLWIFHDTFNPDTAWVENAKAQYRAGTVGDVACKEKLIEVLVSFLEPMRIRRAMWEKDKAAVWEVIRSGNARAKEISAQTLAQVKACIHQVY